MINTRPHCWPLLLPHRGRRVRTTATRRVLNRLALPFPLAVLPQPRTMCTNNHNSTILIDIIREKGSPIRPFPKLMNTRRILPHLNSTNKVLTKATSFYLVMENFSHARSLLASSSSGSGLILVMLLFIIGAVIPLDQLELFSSFFRALFWELCFLFSFLS